MRKFFYCWRILFSFTNKNLCLRINLRLECVGWWTLAEKSFFDDTPKVELRRNKTHTWKFQKRFFHFCSIFDVHKNFVNKHWRRDAGNIWEHYGNQFCINAITWGFGKRKVFTGFEFIKTMLLSMVVLFSRRIQWRKRKNGKKIWCSSKDSKVRVDVVRIVLRKHLTALCCEHL